MSDWNMIGDLELRDDGKAGISIKDAHGQHPKDDEGRDLIHWLNETGIEQLEAFLAKRRVKLTA